METRPFRLLCSLCERSWLSKSAVTRKSQLGPASPTPDAQLKPGGVIFSRLLIVQPSTTIKEKGIVQPSGGQHGRRFVFYRAMREKLQEAAGQASKIRLVHNLQNVLDKNKAELLKRKIRQIEATVSDCFNTLCRKKDTLRRVRINPTNFSVTLYDQQDQASPKERPSAGEKRIDAISMLCALGKILDDHFLSS